MYLEGCVRQSPGNDEIDLADVVECKLLESESVALIIGWRHLKTQAASGGIDKAEQLRVIQENIDVMALAMTNLKHHCRTAAKRPFKVVTASIVPELVDQVDSNVKEPAPLGWTPVISCGDHAASG